MSVRLRWSSLTLCAVLAARSLQDKVGLRLFIPGRPINSHPMSPSPGRWRRAVKGPLTRTALTTLRHTLTSSKVLAVARYLPSNHIFNTRIDDLPVHPKSELWMNVKNVAGRAANQGAPNYLPATFPVNVITSAVPEQKLLFAYTPVNNGGFRIPIGPGLKVQSGTLQSADGWTRSPHHCNRKETPVRFRRSTTLYPPGTNTGDARRARVRAVFVTRILRTTFPMGATDAAGLYITPLSLHRDEILGGHVNHALRVTVRQPFVRNSTSGPPWHTQDTTPVTSSVRCSLEAQIEFCIASKNPYTQELISNSRSTGSSSPISVISGTSP